MKEKKEYLGRYALQQSEDCFKLGRDSLLLGEFATLKAGWRVCDLGCGVGPLLLLLSQRTERLERWGVEIQPQAARLAEENLQENGLDGRILLGDFCAEPRLPTDYFQLVISNPPYFSQGSGASGGPARMEERGSLQALCGTAGRILRTKGRFAVVYPAARLSQLFCAMEAVGIVPKRMQLLCYDREKPPFAVLAEGMKGGGAGLSVLPCYYQMP